jgi:SAM-dependent methyltransferase
MQMNSFGGKQLLSLVRDGDYAHAGEDEAIGLALRPYPRRPDRHLLDVGCGRGGTAQFVQAHGWGTVVGIDLEPDSIARARQVYPAIEFHACDVVDAAWKIDCTFDLIYLFNSFYAFSDQPRALAVLAQLAGAGGQLMVFDYTDRGGYDPESLTSDGEPFLTHPLRLDSIGQTLGENGWRLTAIEDLTGAYERWYDALLKRIERKRPEITRTAGPDGFAAVRGLYAGLLAAIRRGTLGGAIVRAERRRRLTYHQGSGAQRP